MDKKVRLMNVAQTLVTLNGETRIAEVRSQCVEISHQSGATCVAMMNLYGRDSDILGGIQPSPSLVAMIRLPADAVIFPSIDTDGAAWLVSHPAIRVAIRPHKEESIWVDRSYTNAALSPLLADLYAKKRTAMGALQAHRRFLGMFDTSSGNADILTVHEAAVAALLTVVRKIDARIVVQERSFGNANAPA